MADTVMNSNEMDFKKRKNPLTKHRHYTDLLFLGLLFIILAVGVGVFSYVIPRLFYHKEKTLVENLVTSTNPIIDIFDNKRHLDKNFNGYLDKPLFGIWYMLYGTSIILGLLFVYGFSPKIATYIVIISASSYFILQQTYQLVTSCADIFYALPMSINNLPAYISRIAYLMFFNIIASLINLVLIVIIFICIKKIGVKTISEYLHKSFRALFYFPSLILFGFLVLMLELLIIFLVVATLLNSEPTAVMKCLIILSTNYVMLFIYYFGKMVVFEAVATYHWMPDREIPKATVLQCIFTVARFHLGSIAFGSTVILPMFLGLYTAIRTGFYGAIEFNDVSTKIICKIHVICNTADYALIQTAVDGQSFVAATQRTFHLMVKKSELSLVIIYICQALLRLLLLLSFMCCLASFDLLTARESHSGDAIKDMFKPHDPLLTLFIFFMMFSTTLIEASVHTILLCTLEDEENSEE